MASKTISDNYIENIISQSGDGEELIFNSNVRIKCPYLGIDNFQYANLVLTSSRIGVIIESEFKHCLIQWEFTRNIEFDEAERLCYIDLIVAINTDAIKDYTDYPNMSDYVAMNIENCVVTIESENINELWYNFSDLFAYRYQYSLGFVAPMINKIISQIYCFDENEIMMLVVELFKIDPMCGITQVLYTRILKANGKNDEATVYLANNYDKVRILYPELLFTEYFNYDWTPSMISHFAESTKFSEDNTFDKHILNALIYKCNSNQKEFVNEYVRAIELYLHKIYEENNPYYFYAVIFMIRLIVFESNTANFEQIKISVSRNIIVLKNFLKNHYENPDKIVEIIYLEDLLNHHGKLDCITYCRKNKTKKLEEYDIFDWIDCITDNLISDLVVFDILKSFSELRRENSSKLPTYESMKKLEKSIIESRKRFFPVEMNEYLIMFDISFVEVILINNRIGEAFDYLQQSQHQYCKFFGYNKTWFSRYGKELFSFYEAWSNKDSDQLRICLKSIPKDNKHINYLHQLGTKIINEIEQVMDFENNIDNIKIHVNSIIKNFDEIALNKKMPESIITSIASLKQRVHEKLNENEIKIVIVGETSSGKSEFLNAMFDTNMFFVTQEEATGVITEIRNQENPRIEIIDSKGKLKNTLVIDKETLNQCKGNNSFIFGKLFENDGQISKNSKTVYEKFFTFFNINRNIPQKQQIDISINVYDFLQAYTSVNGFSASDISKVKIFLPSGNIPKDIVMIDTPGFNANEKRSEIARCAIVDSHMCIFVIDARNALKGNEMEILNMTRNEVAKTIFVLNKMDLAIGDDDLDCDGSEAAEQTIARVINDLKRRFDLKQVVVFPVTSLRTFGSNKEINEFEANFFKMKDYTINESQKNKYEYIVNLTAKETVNISREILRLCDEIIEKYRKDEKSIIDSMPTNPELLKSEIKERILNEYSERREKYFEKLSDIHQIKFKETTDNYMRWLETIDDKSDLKEIAQKRVHDNISNYLSDLDKIRKDGLNQFYLGISKELENIVKELYSNLPFEAKFDLNYFKNSLNNISIGSYENLVEKIGDIEDGVISSKTASVVGGIIGFAFGGPFGAIGGAFLGDILFGKSIEDIKKDVWEAYCNVINNLADKICNELNSDLQTDNNNSYSNKITNEIYKQIDLYIASIEDKIAEKNKILSDVTKEINMMKELVYKIKYDVELLRRWRDRKVDC